MGRQINFFMLEGDEIRFAEEVRTQKGELVPFRSSSCTAGPITNLLPVSDGLEMCIVPSHRLGEIQFRESRVDGCCLVDEDLSPVIQFHRCRTDGHTLFRGRLWMNPCAEVWSETLGRNLLLPKGEDLVDLYDGLARWLRRSFMRDPEFGFYCGPDAMLWRERGGELSQM